MKKPATEAVLPPPSDKVYYDPRGFVMVANWTIATGAERTGRGTCTCPVCSHTRKKGRYVKCLSYNTERGLFKCHHCGQWEGVVNERMGTQKYKRPEPEYTVLSEKQKWLDWYAGRGIHQSVLEKYEVVFTTHKYKVSDENRDMFVSKSSRAFPYKVRGQVITYKYRSFDKDMSRTSGSALVYGGIDQVPQGAKRLVIVEGEEDLLAAAQALQDQGMSDEIGVVTIPNGATLKGSNLQFHTESWMFVESKLAEGAEVILALDSDDAGANYTKSLVIRIGEERCRCVDFGRFKDSNNYLLAHGSAALCQLFVTSPFYQIEDVIEFDTVEKQLLEINENGREPFAGIGYPGVDEICRFKKGYHTSVIFAPSQTAKSEFMFNIAIRLAVLEGWKFGIFSPETGEPEEIFEALLEVATGKFLEKGIFKNEDNHMTKDDINDAKTFIKSHFYVVNIDEKGATLEQLKASIETMVRRYGINAYIVDPVNNISDFYTVNEEANAGVALINKLTNFRRFNRKYDLHAFFAAHPKSVTGKEWLKITDFFGGSSWIAGADNVLLLRRYFEEKHQFGTSIGDPIGVKAVKIKKRHAGKQGTAEGFLYYEKHSRRIGYFDPVLAKVVFDTYKTLVAQSVKKFAEIDDYVPF